VIDRSARRKGILLFALTAALTATLLAAEPVATAVDSITIVVSDLDRSIEFFSGVLTFEKVREYEVAGETYERLEGVFPLRLRGARMRLGSEEIDLIQFQAPEGQPLPSDARSNDRAFQHIAIIVSNMDRAYAQLREHRVRHASSGPQRLPDWNKNARGIEAFYFKDPDGHALEVLAFPPGKGDPRWQDKSRLFLGIDHTAIVVGDTEASLRFYRDVLGLRVAGESENFGTEQEHLNAVFGARLRITALRAAKGPGIELLEYLSPGDGKPRPAGLHANDLASWQTHIAARDLDAAEHALRSARTPFLSPGVVNLSGPDLGFGAGILVADPDGHELALVR
jgi:catechol 2,3-dioxygenase-like lactoylglutathione lyase family enzyme